jgi:hypothetical protein
MIRLRLWCRQRSGRKNDRRDPKWLAFALNSRTAISRGVSPGLSLFLFFSPAKGPSRLVIEHKILPMMCSMKKTRKSPMKRCAGLRETPSALSVYPRLRILAGN